MIKVVFHIVVKEWIRKLNINNQLKKITDTKFKNVSVGVSVCMYVYD